MNDVHKILFIRTDRIGDVLMTLPAVQLLREAYPKSWITLLLDEKVAPLIEAMPEKDEIIRISPARFETDAPYRGTVTDQIRRAGFDIAVVSNPTKHFHWMVFKAGVRERLGYRRKWDFFLSRTIADDKETAKRHEIDSHLRLAALCTDKVLSRPFKLAVQEADLNTVKEWLRRDGLSDKRIAVVHTGTSNPAKRWSAENFLNVCRWLISDKKMQVLLVGGAEEAETSREILRGLDAKSVTDWTSKTSLPQLAALFHAPAVSFLLSVDSGPVHMAWMSGVPVVSLYAANVPGSDPARWGPRDSKSQIIFKPIAAITTQEVREKIEKVLA